jgi:hypothetical protein
MKNPMDTSNKAIRGAFSSWHKTLGINTDSDLDLYKTLDENDFKRITDKYGMENTTSYIQEMEKRMQKMGG